LVAATRTSLVFTRREGGEEFVVAVGFGADSKVPVPEGRVEVATTPDREGERVGGWVELRANEALVVRVG
jgi:hypothetical protein